MNANINQEMIQYKVSRIFTGTRKPEDLIERLVISSISQVDLTAASIPLYNTHSEILYGRESVWQIN